MPINLPPIVAAACPQGAAYVAVRLDFANEASGEASVTFKKLYTHPLNLPIKVDQSTGNTELKDVNGCVDVYYHINKMTTAAEFQETGSFDGLGDGEFIYTSTSSDPDQKIRRLDIYYKNSPDGADHKFDLYVLDRGVRYHIDPKYHNPGGSNSGILGLFTILFVSLTILGLGFGFGSLWVRKTRAARPPVPPVPRELSSDAEET